MRRILLFLFHSRKFQQAKIEKKTQYKIQIERKYASELLFLIKLLLDFQNLIKIHFFTTQLTY